MTMASLVPVTTRSSSDSSSISVSVGLIDELVLDAPDAHGPDGAEERDLAEAQGRRGAERGEHVVVVLEVDGQHGGHHVDLVHVPLGEQRPDRPVDLAGGEGGLLAGPRLALDEAAGDLAGGIVPLLDVDREGEEILPSRPEVRPVAVTSTIVSPQRTRTDPLACLARRPVSRVIFLPPTSTSTVVMSSFVFLMTRRPIARGFSLVRDSCARDDWVGALRAVWLVTCGARAP